MYVALLYVLYIAQPFCMYVALLYVLYITQPFCMYVALLCSYCIYNHNNRRLNASVPFYPLYFIYIAQPFYM